MKKRNIQTMATALLAAVAVATVIPLTADEHDHHDHDHGGKEAGPNGGRVLHKVEPHLEFFVLKDRKVKLTVLNDKLETADVGKQVVKITAGDRKNPIKMTFSKEGNALVSDKAFPAGDDFPVVVQIKTKPGAKTVIEKFTLDMSPCPTCDYLEYACTCDHGHDHGHDHDHKHEHKKKE